MIHRINNIKKWIGVVGLLAIMLVAGFFARKVYAAVVVDGTYYISVSSADNIDTDGTDTVLVYLAYDDEGNINYSNLELTFQKSGTTSLLPPENYDWEIKDSASSADFFYEIPLGDGIYSYTHSFDAGPNKVNGKYVPGVRKAEVVVKYQGAELAHKTIYVITPISMNGFDTSNPDIANPYFMLKRQDDNLVEHEDLSTSWTMDISAIDNIDWYYRPITHEDDEEFVKLNDANGVNRYVEIETYTSTDGPKVRFTSKNSSGGITIVGRIPENGYATETVKFDVLIAAYAPENDPNEGVDTIKDMVYGQSVLYNNIVNHMGDMNVTYDYDIEEQVDVVLLNEKDENSRKIVGNYFGEVELVFSPVTWELTDKYNQLYNKLKCSVTANVVFDIIKAVGNTGWSRVVPGSTEILSVGSSITVMTNRKSVYGEHLYWNRIIDNSSVSLDNYEDEIKAVPIIDADYNYNAGFKITAKEGSEMIIQCESNLLGADIGLRQFNLIVTDGLTIDPAAVDISVGDSVNINVEASDKKSPIYWDIVNADGEPVSGIISFTSDPNGKTTARITGLKAGTVYVTATQSTGNTTITAKCKVNVSDSLEEATLYGEISEGKVTLPQGETVTLDVELWDSKGNIFEVTEDDIKWVSLSPEIASVEMNPYKPTNATITALNVGKAYVAVVANDISQTQIDVVEVIVVAAPSGITLSEHNVEDSFNNSSYRLVATIQPEGARELEIEWTSSDPTIATVNENGLVTYIKPGEVVITAMVGKYTDSCILKIITPVDSITLNETEKTLKIGDILELIPVILPDNATHKEVVWESSDTRVATVDENGIVTAVGAGSAYIKCTSADGNVSVNCTIHVYQQVTELKLNYDKLTVRKGTILWLYASFIPDTARNKDIIWTSSNPEVASIDEFGQITALATGMTVITATSADTGASDSCELTVSESVTGITLNIRHETLEIGETVTVIPTVTPVEAENKEVTFTSSDPSVASVTPDGLVTGLKGGTTVIICQTVDRGLIASCTITVNEYISDIKFVEQELYIPKGEKKTLDIKILPESATIKELEWKSQDDNILMVDENGTAYAVDYGTVIVTVSTTDGSEKKATCKVTVIKPTTSVSLNEKMIEVEEGKKHKLEATILPEDASIKKLIWTSSDTSVAKVDNKGNVTGVKEGVCIVTATAEDGSGAFDKCEVTVTKSIPVTGITVNPQDATMIVGEERVITARMKPTNTTEKYSWVSSDTSVAVVDDKGKVTAVGTGTATITAITDITGAEGSFKVTVIALNATKVTLEQYDSYNLYLDGMKGGVTWYSKNKRVATVGADGVIVARQAGTTSIVARINGKRVVCEVTVTDLK
ncbi:MAG: Ig-like domain-containing protein [Lachnospiraceae bacterium]|nr:Ig-like domain-containing protein [Lachnospiraceae bacterium]